LPFPSLSVICRPLWQNPAGYASQVHRHELLHKLCLSRTFQFRPLLDSPERVSGRNTADESCLSHLDGSLVKEGRSAAMNCFTEPLESRALRPPGSARERRRRSTKLGSVKHLIVMCSICWPRKSEARVPKVSQEHQQDSLPRYDSHIRIAAISALHKFIARLL
jgi:hypothetical protein